MKHLLLALLLAIPLIGYGEAPPFIQYGDRFHPVIGTEGMVVSQDRLASEVGAQILSKGGNAVDAAVATGFALAVTLPQAGNLGGGGFMVLYLAKENRSLAIDYREMAPAGAHRDLFLDEKGEVDKTKARFSHLSAGVPGTVAGLLHAQQAYGELPLREVLAPAIALAEKGFKVDYPFTQALQQAVERLLANPASASYFFDGHNNPPKPGSRFKQRDLAATLSRISRLGVDGFYKGKTADLIVDEMQRGGGLITHQDLENYKVVERQPTVGTYRGYEIVSMPPPSSGGVHLIEMLNLLEAFDLASLGHNSSAYLHLLIESARRAYADRAKYLGDPDFTAVPVEKITSKAYAGYLRKGIDPDRATLSSDIGPGLKNFPGESPQTTHYSVWDASGNVVSNTYTLNFSFGSGISVPGAGFLLNNEMDDFSAKAGVPNAYGLLGDQANEIAPGKRPLSSMTPTIVFHQGKPVLATGSPGGSTIITNVIQIILNTIDFKMNIAEATAAPRIHHQWQPDLVFWEDGISPDTRDLLVQQGHILRDEPSVLGRVQSISQAGPWRQGYSDNRWPGGAAVSE